MIPTFEQAIPTNIAPRHPSSIQITMSLHLIRVDFRNQLAITVAINDQMAANIGVIPVASNHIKIIKGIERCPLLFKIPIALGMLSFEIPDKPMRFASK